MTILPVTLNYFRQTSAKIAINPGSERFAQEALGHSSKAVHRAYARKPQVRPPWLESYEQKVAEERIIQIAQFDLEMHQVGTGGQKAS